MPTKYFLYSSEQLRLRKAVEERMGKRFRIGHVYVNGERRPFTELSSTETSRFADAKVVASGDPAFMKYTLPGGQ